MRFTVFTPAYNRANLLGILYGSLKRQTFKDFEWVVVDDCSKDNTADLFNEWTKEKNDFEIRYIKREKNGGKHRAINDGVATARGEMFVIVDSDDWLREDALELADKLEKTIKNKNQFAGVAFNKCYPNGDLVGSTFEGEILDATNLERKKYGMLSDKAEIFYTAVLRAFPFPEFEGEVFVTEATVWNEIAHAGYKIRWCNQNVYYCEYLPGGLSDNAFKLNLKNPLGWRYYYERSMVWYKKDKLAWIQFFMLYIRFSLHATKKITIKKGYFFLTMFLLPLCYINYLRDKYKFKKM